MADNLWSSFAFIRLIRVLRKTLFRLFYDKIPTLDSLPVPRTTQIIVPISVLPVAREHPIQSTPIVVLRIAGSEDKKSGD